MTGIEIHAYGNRWRRAPAEAKAAFAVLAMVAAFVARPAVALPLAAGLAALTIAGAGVPVRGYLRAVRVPATFLLVGALAIVVSLRPSADGLPVPVLDLSQADLAVRVLARSLAALAAMLFLAFTTPMTDVISLARRLRVPSALVEVMSVCYRSLSVLDETVADMRRAQAARLGYATFSGSVRSMGTSVGLLAVEMWRRSIVMHQASVARVGGGDLRFLEPEREGRRGPTALAILAGAALLALALAEAMFGANGGLR